MKLHKLGLVVSAAVIAVAFGVAPAAYAHESHEEHVHGRELAEERRETAEQRHEEVRTVSTDKRETAQARLEDKKLQAYERREKVIKSIMARIADRGQKQVDLFTTIADRTKTFYANKNLSVENYDALVSEVEAKKTAAQTTIDEVKAKGESFACDADNPKGIASSFKESLKAEIAAVKAYRTAVKDLIVGVKSAQNTTPTNEDGEQ